MSPQVPQVPLRNAAMEAMKKVRADERKGLVTYQGGYIVRFSRSKGITRKDQLKRPFYFQVAPMEEVRYTQAGEHTEYNVLSRKQLSNAAAKQLLQVSFRAVMLDYVPGWASFDHARFPNNGPADWVTQLRRVMRSLTPFQVNMGNPRLVGRWEVDGLFTLRQVDAVENAGEPDARYVDIQLSEFDAAELDVHKKGDEIVRVYRDGRVRPYSGIKKPPTLAKISRKVYGTTKHWDAIGKASGMKGWTANRDLRQYVRKKRGRELIKLKCPAKRSERLKRLT